MGIVKYTAEEAKHLRGDSDDERLAKMTDEEIEQAAQNDPDNPSVSKEELKEFKPAVHRGGGVYAHEKNKRKSS